MCQGRTNSGARLSHTSARLRVSRRSRCFRPAAELAMVGVMTDQGALAAKAAAVYDAASDHFAAAPLGFWDRFGAETVRRIALPSGAHVLDLCCGAGASALEAARVTGP